MLNINKLEQRHKRYKIKSYLPIGIITISLLTIVSIIITFSLQKKELSQEKQKPMVQTPITEKTITVNTHPVIIKPVPSQEPLKPKSVEKLTITPSLNFIQEINSKQVQTIEEKPAKAHQIKTEIIVPQKTQVLALPQAEIKVETIKKLEPPVNYHQEKSNSINISRQSTHKDIKDVIQRFNKNNNPALSLFVAKKYYELGDYEKSYNYALITNEINNDIESSWIIFSKSLVKLNKKEKAIVTLRKYVNHSGSNRASMLLDNIISGKFR